MAIDRATRLANLRAQVLSNSAARRLASDKKTATAGIASVAAGIPADLSGTVSDFEARIIALETP
jgi:hypothetical protein